MRVIVAGEEHESRLAANPAIRAATHLVDSDANKLLHIVVDAAAIAPYEVPAFPPETFVAGEGLVEGKELKQVAGEHYIFTVAGVWRPGLAAPIGFGHRISPDVVADVAPDATEQDAGGDLTLDFPTAPAYGGGGVAAEGDVVALGEKTVLRPANVPPFALLVLWEMPRDMVEPAQRGAFVRSQRVLRSWEGGTGNGERGTG